MFAEETYAVPGEKNGVLGSRKRWALLLLFPLHDVWCGCTNIATNDGRDCSVEMSKELLLYTGGD